MSEPGESYRRSASWWPSKANVAGVKSTCSIGVRTIQNKCNTLSNQPVKEPNSIHLAVPYRKGRQRCAWGRLRRLDTAAFALFVRFTTQGIQRTHKRRSRAVLPAPASPMNKILRQPPAPPCISGPHLLPVPACKVPVARHQPLHELWPSVSSAASHAAMQSMQGHPITHFKPLLVSCIACPPPCFSREFRLSRERAG